MKLLQMMKWANRNQFITHASIGFGWAFAGASSIWFGNVPVFVAYFVGLWSAVVHAVAKEVTDETVNNALRGMSYHFHGEQICEQLDWHGWDWGDFTEIVFGGFLGTWCGILVWFWLG